MDFPRQFIVTQGDITQFFDTWVTYQIIGRKTRILNGKTEWKHEALDIVTKGSQALRPLSDGVITKVIDLYDEDHKTGFGNELWILYSNGITGRFCHMRRGFLMKVGQHVGSTDIVGYTGRTGYRIPETVWHVHYEEYFNGERIDPLQSANQLTEQEMEKYDNYISQTDRRLNDLEQGQRDILEALEKQGIKVAKSKKWITRLLLRLKNTRHDLNQVEKKIEDK
jgi:murein DD-endopeptidase MepM/ murein hydrolase activator NlpD